MGRLKIKLHCLESVDSTNTYLKELAKKGAPEGTLVVANGQTAGRGRLGRSFYSAPGLGIYMSLLLRPNEQADCVMSLTAFTAVAVCRAIKRVTGLSPEVKWINDIILNGKKICGILCESAVNGQGTDYAVIGIGLNLITRAEDFPPELRYTAGSIFSESGFVCDRGTLISAIIAELDAMYTAWCADKTAYHEEYCGLCKTTGREITLGSSYGEATVTALTVEPDFGLRIRTPDGQELVIKSGEISVL